MGEKAVTRPLTKAPTLQDVAVAAGVSAQTVSRVINERSDVSDVTQARVRAAIAELGYRPNSIARSLVQRGVKTIGLIVTDFAQGFFPDITRSIEREAGRRGYAVHIITATGEPSLIRNALDRVRDDQFAGVIVNTSTAGFESNLQAAVRAGFPVVLVHRESPEVKASVRWRGYRDGAELAVDHLISIGCRRIGFLATERSDLVDTDKLSGYRAALERHGLEFDKSLVISSPHDFQGGFSAAAESLLRFPDLDGMFVTSDVRAVGALRALALSGKRVPQDIAVVAFGGSSMASMVTPSISTIRVPRAAMGREAVNLLFQVIAGEPAGHRYVHEQPTLELGESTLRIAPNGVTPHQSD